jgi:hypothetical protein
MKIVEITWRDITSDDGWHGVDRLDELIHDDDTVRQVGYLYEEDEEQVILLDSYFQHKELFGGIHKIPRGCIIEIKELVLSKSKA